MVPHLRNKTRFVVLSFYCLLFRCHRSKSHFCRRWSRWWEDREMQLGYGNQRPTTMKSLGTGSAWLDVGLITTF